MAVLAGSRTRPRRGDHVSLMLEIHCAITGSAHMPSIAA